MNEQTRAELWASAARALNLALEVEREGRLDEAARLAADAQTLAEQIDDLPLLLRARLRVAAALRAQGKAAESLPIYLWVIGLATDPQALARLSDDANLWNLMRGFGGFIGCSFALPEMPLADVLRTADEAEAWLQQVGKPLWAAGLHLQRSLLLQRREDWSGAIRAGDSGLAMARRLRQEVSGYGLADHLLSLAAILSNDEVREYSRAITLIEEALALPLSATDRFRAWSYLASARLESGDQAGAEAASAAAMSDPPREAPAPLRFGWDISSKIERAAGRVDATVAATVETCRWAARHDCTPCRYYALLAVIRARLLQARAALLLALPGPELPATLPGGADPAAARRYLASAERFAGLTAAPAATLDRADGHTSHARKLQQWRDEAASLSALIDATA